MSMPESAYLYGAVLSLVVQILKPITNKYGEQTSKNIVYVLIFVGAVAFTVATNNPTWGEKINRIIGVITASIATYELIIKNVQPMIEKSFTKKQETIKG